MIVLILTLAIVGFLTYLIVAYIPMPKPVAQAIIVIVVIVIVLYVIRIIGVGDLPVPRLGR